MSKEQIMRLLRSRIDSCYKDLKLARSNHSPILYVEGFRCRLDELILVYHIIEDMSFIEVCKELKINYKDVTTEDA